MHKELKNEVLRIRCTWSTKVKFKRFAAEFRNYEEALKFLLAKAEEYGWRRGKYL